jgi:hypothetical protein
VHPTRQRASATTGLVSVRRPEMAPAAWAQKGEPRAESDRMSKDAREDESAGSMGKERLPGKILGTFRSLRRLMKES